jgi:vancomycin aglycone glucosyltransferase
VRILLTSIGTRGDVQPIVALALELKARGQQPLICAAPNFQTWVESFGIDFVPIGPDLEKWTTLPRPTTPSTQDQLRALASQTVKDQFQVMLQTAQGCNLIVVGGMLQTAARSVAESLQIPYVYAAYCPATLPSPDHPPAKIREAHSQLLSAEENLRLWQEDAQSFNRMFGEALNAQREGLGLASVQSVSQHITTDHPWLAADPVLGPAGTPVNMRITQTGAWLLSDPAPLPEPLEAFLQAGEPPIYFGFGSMRAADTTGERLIAAARALGYRSLLSQGWANLRGDGADCFSIGSIDHQKLFPRVAAVVHHGGAGTTTTTARAGTPQVIIPHNYDQFYWAHRVTLLGVGASMPNMTAWNVDSLTEALRACLKPEVAANAAALAARVELHGAQIAADQLLTAFA